MAQFKVGDLAKEIDTNDIFYVVNVYEKVIYVKDIKTNKMFACNPNFYTLVEAPKTADEMLAELGWEKDNEDDVEARYYKNQRCLLFYKINKSVEKFYGSQGYSVSISPKELKAIYKKEEELGWL